MNDALGSRYRSEQASPGFMLWRVTNRWQGQMRRALEPYELTHVQFVLLATLTWFHRDEGMTQTELAGNIRSDPMMVSQVLRTLEKKGLVRRDYDDADGRARRVQATAAGMARAREATQAVEAVDADFFSAAAGVAPLIDHLQSLDVPE